MLSRCALQQFTAKLCSTILARACKNTIRAGKCSHGARYSNSLQNCAPPFSRVLVQYNSCGKMLSRCALQQFTAKLCSTMLARACKNTIRAERCSHGARYSNSLQNYAPTCSRVLVKIQFVLKDALTVRVTAIHCKTVLHHSRACL